MGNDVAIIGAGIIGCSTAYFLAREGVKVTVYDPAGIASGASGRNNGLIEHPYDADSTPLFFETVELMRDLVGDALPAQPGGVLLLADDEPGARDLVRHYAQFPELRAGAARSVSRPRRGAPAGRRPLGLLDGDGLFGQPARGDDRGGRSRTRRRRRVRARAARRVPAVAQVRAGGHGRSRSLERRRAGWGRAAIGRQAAVGGDRAGRSAAASAAPGRSRARSCVA